MCYYQIIWKRVRELRRIDTTKLGRAGDRGHARVINGSHEALRWVAGPVTMSIICNTMPQ